MTDDDLDRLARHAEYGHLEGQDYDTAVAAVAEVRQLREEVEHLTRVANNQLGKADRAIHERDRLREGIGTAVEALEPHAGVHFGGGMVVSMVYAHLRMLLLDDARSDT